MKINCYINEEFPIIATASRADLLSEDGRQNALRYPIVHAILMRREIAAGHEFYVDFQSIGEGFTDPSNNASLIRDSLIRFVSDSYAANKFTFKVGDQFFKVSDMSGTALNAKYFLMPADDGI